MAGEVVPPSEVQIESDQFQAPGPLRYVQFRREMIFLVVASVLATIPVWIATYPPMVDLPQNASQIALLRNLHDPSFRFAGLFEVNWFTPYLFGYMAVYALVPLLGIIAACKLVISVALAGLPLSTSLLMKETGADRYWALLTIPAMYGFTYDWGFLNFLVAAPIGLVFLAFVMRHTRKPGWATSAWLGLFTVLLFFCHALICGFFGLIACVFILAESSGFRKALATMAPMASVVPIMVIWYLRTKSIASTQTETVWDLGWMHSVQGYTFGGRINGFFPRLLGMESNGICIFLGACLFALPLIAGARPAKRLTVWIPLIVCLFAILLFPATFWGTYVIYERFTVFALPFFLLGMKPSARPRREFRAAAIILILGWMVILTAHTVRYDAEAKDFNQILNTMAPNERALSLIFAHDTDSFPSPVFIHFPAWYSATKKGVVDFSFAMFYNPLVRYKSSKTPPIKIGFIWEPETFQWAGSKGGNYRYFVVRAPNDMGGYLFRGAPCRITLAAHSNLWWLYEKDSSCSSSESF